MSAPGVGAGIDHVELGVEDLERSRAFYGGLLGLTEVAPVARPAGRPTAWFDAGGSRLALVEVGNRADPGGWADDDLQRGVRHVGLKVGDVDAQVRRLQEAGTRVLSTPADVLGGVRIAFFLDPDGARLEYVQGVLDYQRVGAPDLVAAEAAARPAPTAGPRFDHVGLTVADLDATLDLYCGTLGYRVVGDIRHVDDDRGFLMTYLSTGRGVLEVFSFDVPTRPGPTPAPDRSGVRAVGLALPPALVGVLPPQDPDGVALAGVPVDLEGRAAPGAAR